LIIACERHYPKTSGKTGLHIVVPLGARYSYEDCRNFRTFDHADRACPPARDHFDRAQPEKKRGGKIYLDYLQNRRGQTLACAYSVRPYRGATVSTPLEWREVKKGLDPADFTINTIGERLKKKGDLWRQLRKKESICAKRSGVCRAYRRKSVTGAA